MFSILITLAIMAQNDARLTPGDHTRSLMVSGRERSYLIHAPASFDPAKATAVVLIFHGGGTNAAQMVHFCGLNEKADEAGFLAVYPNGTGRTEQLLSWNAGNCCGYAQQQNVDDVEFVCRVLDDLATVAKIDTDHVYATGMSNGAMMAYRLASELSDRIAAIAPVAGPMGTQECHPQRAVPVLHFHGTDDQFAPLAGGRGERSLSQTDFYSVEHSLGCWIKANACQEKPVAIEMPVKVADGTKATRKTWGQGKNGAEVVLIEITGMGHTWPGRKPAVLFLGKPTMNVSANDEIWEFFKKHPRLTATR